jgi:hypothetical protein
VTQCDEAIAQVGTQKARATGDQDLGRHWISHRSLLKA